MPGHAHIEQDQCRRLLQQAAQGLFTGERPHARHADSREQGFVGQEARGGEIRIRPPTLSYKCAGLQAKLKLQISIG